MKRSNASHLRRGPILALDLGAVRTGVAVSTSALLTQPVGLVRGGLDAQIQQIAEIARRFEVTEVVLGAGPRGVAFMAAWQQSLRPALPVAWSVIDEAYTTKEAERLARATGVRHQSDTLAAELILEQYLAEQNSKSQSPNHK